MDRYQFPAIRSKRVQPNFGEVFCWLQMILPAMLIHGVAFSCSVSAMSAMMRVFMSRM